MKRTFSLVFLLTISLTLLIIGYTKQITLLAYVGAGLSIFFSLNIVIDIIKLAFKITFTSLLSIAVNTLSLATVGCLMWNNLIPPKAAYCLTILFSLFLIISILRKLGQYSKTHKMINSIFVSITNYKGTIRTDKFITIKDKRFEKMLSKSLNSKGSNN